MSAAAARARGIARGQLARMRHRRLRRRLAARRLLRAFADGCPAAVFVEVGANDGEQHDHLRPFILARQWRGVMVEPVPYVFARLEANYGHLERVALEPAAIADRDGTLPFHMLCEPAPEERALLPSWYDGVGSFSREAVLRHARDIPGLEGRIVTRELPCLTFDSLCARHGIAALDLVLIDTEGYDWEVIRGLDLARWAPRLLIYEHFHLPPAERAECRSHVEAHGYETIEEGFDTLCLRTATNDGVTRCWRRLRPAVPGVSAHELRR